MSYKNYIAYYNVYCCYCGVFIEKYVCTKFHGYCVSESHCHIMSLSYCNAWGSLFLFYKNYIVYRIVYMIRVMVAITSPSFVTLHHLVSEIAKCIA